jgi:hypothetical protein
MDLSSVASLGKIAGIGGIAVGMIIVLVRLVIAKTSSLPKVQQAPLLRLVVWGAFAVGGLGIVASSAPGLFGTSVHVDPCAVGAGRDARGNTVTCTNVAVPPTEKQQ